MSCTRKPKLEKSKAPCSPCQRGISVRCRQSEPQAREEQGLMPSLRKKEKRKLHEQAQAREEQGLMLSLQEMEGSELHAQAQARESSRKSKAQCPPCKRWREVSCTRSSKLEKSKASCSPCKGRGSVNCVQKQSQPKREKRELHTSKSNCSPKLEKEQGLMLSLQEKGKRELHAQAQA